MSVFISAQDLWNISVVSRGGLSSLRIATDATEEGRIMLGVLRIPPTYM